MQDVPKGETAVTTRRSRDRVAFVLGTGLGIGLIPWAPGTFGSLLGPPLVMVCQQSGLSIPPLLLVGTLFILAGIPICSGAARWIGRKDPGSIVYDEIAAFWIVFLPQLLMARPIDVRMAVAGFVLFRVFDIAKPWPVKKLEQLPDGLGVMADDLMAGVFAAGCLWLLLLI